MSTEETKAVVSRVMERLDQRDLDAVIELSTPDAAWHGFAPQTLDSDGYKQFMSALLDAFPDSRFPVDDMISEGDKAAARHTFHGTQRGEFQGIPATGNLVTVPATATFHVADGKVVEVWLNADFLGLMQQLGAIPAPEPAGA